MFFFFNDTATTDIYTLSLHDALPIWQAPGVRFREGPSLGRLPTLRALESLTARSEEHTSELQSRQYLVCRLLLEKKKIPTPSKSTTAKANQRAPDGRVTL